MAVTRLYAPRPYDSFDPGIAGVAPILATGTDVDNTKLTSVQAAAVASGVGTLPTSAGGTAPTPVAEPLRFRGAWQALTAYSYGDVVSQAGLLYVAPMSFTSGSTFSSANWTQLGLADGSTVGGSGASQSGLTPTGTKTGAYTASAGDLVPANATSGGFTVTLPASPTAGQIVGVYKTDSSANVVTVAGTIDGQTNATIVTQNAGGTFEYVGGSTGWKLVSTYSTVGPQGPAGPTGPQGGSGVQPVMAAGVVGAWYACSALASNSLSNRSIAAGTMTVGTPVVLQEATTIDALGCYVQTVGAATLVRLGLYQVTGTNPYDITLGSAYGTLLVDTGTTPTSGNTSTVGPVKFTLGSPQVLAAGTSIVIGMAVQGTGNLGVYHEGLAASSGFGPTPWGASDILSGPRAQFTVSSVTGALPATLTPGAFGAAGIGGAGFYHRSA